MFRDGSESGVQNACSLRYDGCNYEFMKVLEEFGVL